ncbi:MAG: HDOD domain-containing protein [Acidimicrobiia bacterium]|nr:HDOD domain-containing protein [Acidimicrobiia bacterium]
MIDLDALAHAASSLDPLPASLSRLAGAVSRDIPDVDEITEVVGFDEALTATLLRAANSSWSASREPITTVRAAVVRLGSGTVLSMALGGNVRARMHQALPEFGLEEGDLWRHSVAVALAAELMPRFVRVALPAEVVTAGLLHDFGKLLMARFLDDGTLSLLERARAEGAGPISGPRRRSSA